MDTEGDVKMEHDEEVKSEDKPPTMTQQTSPAAVMIKQTGPAPTISSKHPVMQLNDLTKDIQFELSSEVEQVDKKKRKIYTMLLTVNNEKFQGLGPSKKMAKEEAAKYALLKLYNILYIPEGSLSCFVSEGTVIKRPAEIDTESMGQPTGKKKKKKTCEGPKNPVMRLYELRSELSFVVEEQTGPVHAPTFNISVEVDGKKYVGCGSSKKKAKFDVATKVLMVIEPSSVTNSMVCEPSTTT